MPSETALCTTATPLSSGKEPAPSTTIHGHHVQGGPSLLDMFHNMQEIIERAGETIALPDQDDIPQAQVIEEAVEVRAIPPPPRGLLGEGPFDSCCAQGGLLQPGVLGLAFRDAY